MKIILLLPATLLLLHTPFEQQVNPSIAPAPTPEKLTGCVVPAADDSTITAFVQGGSCTHLTGTFDLERVVGHTVTFQGIRKTASENLPAQFTVQKTFDVGPACTATCRLVPPPVRGVHRKVQGTTASTPGEQPPPKPQ